MTKKLIIQSNQTLYYTCARCCTCVKFFDLTTMINVIKIIHPNMTPYHCDVNFNDVITLKFKKININIKKCNIITNESII